MTTAELTGLELIKQTAAATDRTAYIGTLIGLSIDEVQYGEVIGRKTATAEGRVYDPQGRLVAHGTTTCMIHR